MCPRAPKESTLSRSSPRSSPGSSPRSGPGPRPRPSGTDGLDRLNRMTAGAAEAALLCCCGSRRWARLIADHRPYPDLGALLAAGDEASYDLNPADLAEALADESMTGHPLPAEPGVGSLAAHTALRAAHAAYEQRFGHAFVICLDGLAPDETLDRLLTGIRDRLGNEPEEERINAAEELRRIARGRLTRLAAPGAPMPDIARFRPA
ncbi:2-oxo-4-hydroxy-4-carboxy-5-ureidoimidazoline decarboxylase [Streptomyces sp. NPDC019937]|uniref:2-oxo-4-hydroxy-4-carboxy-5-ureidoimidazoline decarboxylase n=1 Tax=Streptomyces sp. NPDC019937 TaxID=3154787 RepID=UPI0033DB31D5